MPSEQTNTKVSFLVLGAFTFILALSAVAPAKWFGVQPKKYTKLNLSNIVPARTLSGDVDNNSVPDWRDLLVSEMSTTTKKLAQEAKVDPEAAARLKDPNNLTASFSKNVYVASAYLKKNGGATTASQQETLTALMNEEAKKIIIKGYSLDDIVIATTESNETRKQYGNALGALLKKAETYKMGEGDVATMKAYSTSKDATLLESLVIKKGKLDTLITSMTKVSVPLSATPYHLLVLNRMSEYSTLLDGLSKAKTDPVRSSLAFEGYLSTMKSLFGAIKNVQAYFISENITFTSKEAGYIFMQTESQ